MTTVRNQHPYLNKTISLNELQELNGLVDHNLEILCRQDGIKLETILWFATQGWKNHHDW